MKNINEDFTNDSNSEKHIIKETKCLKDNNFTNEKSWNEFRESGLLWLVNSTLHVFGWSLVAEIEPLDGEGKFNITKVYPARVKFRGFSEQINTEGFKKISKFMTKNAEELEKEANE